MTAIDPTPPRRAAEAPRNPTLARGTPLGNAQRPGTGRGPSRHRSPAEPARAPPEYGAQGPKLLLEYTARQRTLLGLPAVTRRAGAPKRDAESR